MADRITSNNLDQIIKINRSIEGDIQHCINEIYMLIK